MSGQRDTYAIGSTRINVGVLGASCFPVLVTPPSGMVDGYLSRVSGGSLEIMPRATSGATAGGLGYLLGASEIYHVGGPAAFYLAASGSTAVVALNVHFSAGATLG